jgi:hypothetical protein
MSWESEGPTCAAGRFCVVVLLGSFDSFGSSGFSGRSDFGSGDEDEDPGGAAGRFCEMLFFVSSGGFSGFGSSAGRSDMGALAMG